MAFEFPNVEAKIHSCFRLGKSVQFFNRASLLKYANYPKRSKNIVIYDYVIFIKSTLFWLIYSILTIIHPVQATSRRNFMNWWKKMKLKKMLIFHDFFQIQQFLVFEGVPGTPNRELAAPMDKNMYSAYLTTKSESFSLFAVT